MTEKSEEIKEEIKALEETARIARFAGSGMFWSPQEKEDFLEEIDNEIDGLYDKLQ